jgi:hypothetical protein
MNPPNFCRKCGLDHNNPNSTKEAVQILACALRADAKFIIRDGEVPTPNIEDYIS